MMNTDKNQTKHSKISLIKEILDRGDKSEIRALFAFNKDTSEEKVLLKLNIWGRHFFPKFYKAKDAPFHKQIDTYNLRIYRGQPVGIALKILKFFVDIAFRGAAKTTRTKIAMSFCIANDEDHYRRYIKVLSADGANSKQIVTDIYNMLMNKAVNYYYSEIFQKTVEKRQETMATFTTSTGVKMQADSVGTDQRGDIQEDSRPDLIWFDDFETRKTLRSAVTTNAIWDNMEEAKNGLSKNGACLYNCNYFSERGNVHKLVEKYKNSDVGVVMITPIKGSVVNNVHRDGPPTWDAYTPEEVEQKLKDADDPAGEYLCVPSAGADIMFDRTSIDRQECKTPIRDIAGFKIYHDYDPSHRYGAGEDVSGGVGLDSSTIVLWDFSRARSTVVATFKSNTIKPDTFGDQIKNSLDRFGAPITAPENNSIGAGTIGRLKQIYDNIFFQEQKETRVGAMPSVKTLGWNTNSDTKPRMIFALKKAVEDGFVELSDPDLIAELRSYTRDDLMDKDDDVRLTTRHFDLLMAAAIGYQMKDYATVSRDKEGSNYQQPAYEPPTNE